ncbi:homeodomain-interacting protein kinase 1-like [Mugil cephalus]|uniref:homeodomain-interacting protein kinase 1-like n=1 Tax=Mugil cephalus TaxID=48193 RepID=UPI001FB6081D|nr:homeodomain-interacting protein kinase 1-like [Mugil cephalus]
MYPSSPSSSSSLKFDSHCSYPVPTGYEFVRILGQGGFGTVLECTNKKSDETAAVKVFTQIRHAQWEARIMRILMQYKMDSSNIIKYQGAFSDSETMSLIFELLDITLEEYLNMFKTKVKMRLEDIRIVIQQMAVAFDALKSVGVIHGDLKLNNIMMVDHVSQPFKIKLIDFGLAMFRWNTTPGKPLQTPQYRAPEIILGLPFSEAIDIWSLGCVMAYLMLGVRLFPSKTEYTALRFMTDLLGPPPQHLLRFGSKTGLFYKKVDGQWQMKTNEEYCQEWGKEESSLNNRSYTFCSLDETKAMRLETDNPTEAEERRECVELLKAMLQWDEKDRITPSGILKHPFITKSYLNNTSDLSGPSSSEPEGTTSHNHMDVGTQTEDNISEALPPGVILVQPADPENRIHFEDEPKEDPGLR